MRTKSTWKAFLAGELGDNRALGGVGQEAQRAVHARLAAATCTGNAEAGPSSWPAQSPVLFGCQGSRSRALTCLRETTRERSAVSRTAQFRELAGIVLALKTCAGHGFRPDPRLTSRSAVSSGCVFISRFQGANRPLLVLAASPARPCCVLGCSVPCPCSIGHGRSFKHGGGS